MKPFRIAVVLFNLGGPDGPEAVRPFLFNLFRDRAIIRLPAFLRYPIAALIASRRAKEARVIYERLGGSSPLLQNTQEQARALEKSLQTFATARVFVAMRYWHPMTKETAAMVEEFNPDIVVGLPLYPQFSTTTTASSFAEWEKYFSKTKSDVRCLYVRSYAEQDDFISAHAALIGEALSGVDLKETRLLFSAHGLPEKIVAAGDPYPQEVEASCKAIVSKLAAESLDWALSYQSRVGPLKWIGPSTEEEVHRAARDGKGLVVVPIAFVSEHSETLVELDEDYATLAKDCGVAFFKRVPALGTHPFFIDALRKLVQAAVLQHKDDM